ncbi:hypothetical protein BDF22DRAFT_667235 [Syncephalis plumigaleata]|nr:hypothetical protein BDF22DRAFT_667235 [Syncephalis plumigaleata]
MRPALLKPRRRVNKSVAERRNSYFINPLSDTDAHAHHHTESASLGYKKLGRSRTRFQASGRATHDIALCNARAELRHLNEKPREELIQLQHEYHALLNKYENSKNQIQELQQQGKTLRAENDALRKRERERESQFNQMKKRCELYANRVKKAEAQLLHHQKENTIVEEEEAKRNRRHSSLIKGLPQQQHQRQHQPQQHDQRRLTIQAWQESCASAPPDHRRRQSQRRYSELPQPLPLNKENNRRDSNIQWVACNDPPGTIPKEQASDIEIDTMMTTTSDDATLINSESTSPTVAPNDNVSSQDIPDIASASSSVEESSNNGSESSDNARIRRNALENLMDSAQKQREQQKIATLQREEISKRNRDLYSGTRPIQPRYHLSKETSRVDNYRRATLARRQSGRGEAFPDIWQEQLIDKRRKQTNNTEA